MSDGRTHDEGCERVHLDCALRKLAEARDEWSAARRAQQAALRERDRMQSQIAAIDNHPNSKLAGSLYYERMEKAEAERDRLCDALLDMREAAQLVCDDAGINVTWPGSVALALAVVKESGENDAASGGEVASGVFTRGQDVSGNRDAAVAPEGNASPTQAATPDSLTLTRDELRALVRDVQRAMLRVLAEWEAKR